MQRLGEGLYVSHLKSRKTSIWVGLIGLFDRLRIVAPWVIEIEYGAIIVVEVVRYAFINLLFVISRPLSIHPRWRKSEVC